MKFGPFPPLPSLPPDNKNHPLGKPPPTYDVICIHVFLDKTEYLNIYCKAELNKTSCELGPDILCVDSYVGIKEIFRRRAERDKAKEVEREIVEVNIHYKIVTKTP